MAKSDTPKSDTPTTPKSREYIPWIIIFITLIILNVCIYYAYTQKMKTPEVKYEEKYDTIIHVPVNNQAPILHSLDNLKKFNPDLITSLGNDLSQVHSDKVSRKLDRAYQNFTELGLDRPHLQSGFAESWRIRTADNNITNYMGISLTKFRPLTDPKLFTSEKLENGIQQNSYIMYSKVERLEDKKEFIFACIYTKRKQLDVTDITIDILTPENVHENYERLYNAVWYLTQTLAPDSEYIITAENDYGLDKVIKNLLPSYHVCDFSKVPTNFDTMVYNINTIAVSDKLYDRIEYSSEIPDGESRSLQYHGGGLILKAKLYITHEIPGVFVNKKWPLKKYFEDVIKRPGVDISMYNNPGTFNPNNISTTDVFTEYVQIPTDEKISPSTILSTY
jgi:hypothetical protein